MSGSEPAPREPRPPGRVSTIRGIRQIPALNVAVAAGGLCAAVGSVIPGAAGTVAAVVAVALVTAAPLARVVWLIHRWRQEDDRGFVRRGVALLAIIAAGSLIAFLGS